MPLLFAIHFISASCFCEVSRCLHSYCNLLFAGGDSRVLAGCRVLQGRLGDSDFLSPPFPFIHLVFCWAASLSVIWWLRIFLHNTFFRQKHPCYLRAWLTKSSVATVTLSPLPLFLWGQTSQALAAEMEGRKCLCKPGNCHRAVSQACCSFHTQITSLVLLF